MDADRTFSTGENTAGDTWYVDNYILLKEYYDMTISRIAARCVRKGNIAIEDYAHYPYILDVLEEISETGEYILTHTNLYEYVERKVSGGINALKKNLNEFKTELQNNASPDMIKQDPNEMKRMREALGEVSVSDDPTKGAGMSMDDVVNKLMQQNNITPNFNTNDEAPQPQMQQRPMQPQAPQPQMQQRPMQPQAPQPQMQQRPMQPQASQPQMQQRPMQPQAPQPQMQQRPMQPQTQSQTMPQAPMTPPQP